MKKLAKKLKLELDFNITLMSLEYRAKAIGTTLEYIMEHPEIEFNIPNENTFWIQAEKLIDISDKLDKFK